MRNWDGVKVFTGLPSTSEETKALAPLKFRTSNPPMKRRRRGVQIKGSDVSLGIRWTRRKKRSRKGERDERLEQDGYL